MTRAAKAHIMSVTQSKEVIANLSRNNSNRFVLEESLVRAPSEEWARRGGGTRRTRRSPVTPRPATRPPRVSPCALSLRGGGVGARPPATCSCALHFCASPTPRRAPAPPKPRQNLARALRASDSNARERYKLTVVVCMGGRGRWGRGGGRRGGRRCRGRQRREAGHKEESGRAAQLDAREAHQGRPRAKFLKSAQCPSTFALE